MGRVAMHRRVPFVGGDRLASRAMRFLQRIRTGGIALLLVGEPGIGKTRALDHLLETPVARDLQLLRTSATELETAVPYGVVARLLGLRPDAPNEAGALGRLLADSGSTPPASLPLQVADGVVDLFERRSIETPIVVVVEDLHWADPDSLRVLARVVANLEHLRVMLLLTARLAPRSQELTSLWRTVDAHQRGQVLRLEPLDETAALELARRLLDAEPGSRLQQAISAMGGNPLYLVELLAVASSAGLVEVDLPDGHLPPPLRDLVLEHLAQLPSATLDILAVAAVMGPVFDLQHLALVLNRPELDVVRDLQPALEAAAVVAQDDRLAFAHDLLQEALYEDQPAAVRAARHRTVVKTLRDAAVPVIDVVPHLLRADWESIPDAADLLHEAGTATASRSPAMAANLLRGALDAAGPGADPRLQADAAKVMLLAGRPDEGRDLLEALAHRPLDSFDEADRDVLVGGAWMTATDSLVPVEQRWELLDRLEAAGLGPEGRTRLAGRRAWLAWLAGRADEAEDWAGQAVDQAVTLASPALMAMTELVLSRIKERRGSRAEAVGHAARALEHARHVDDPFRFVTAAMPYAMILGSEPGTRRDAERVIDEAAVVATRSGSPLLQSHVDAVAGIHDIRWGAWERAIVRLEAVLPVVEEFGELVGPATLAEPPARLARLYVHRGDLTLADERLQIARALFDAAAGAGMSAAEGLTVLCAEIELALARDDGDTATAAAREFQDLAQSRDVGGYEMAFAPLLLQAFLDAGDHEAAVGVVEWTRTIAEDDPGPVPTRTVDWLTAKVTDDAEKLVALIPTFDAHGIPWEFSPMVREDAAAALVTAERTDEAIALLEQALALWDGAGARHDVDRVRAALRDLGVQRGRGPARERPLHGWEALTEAEWRVVTLVAEGLVYREVGERLCISRRTVETHVRNVFRKLDVASRGELTARLMDPEGQERLTNRNRSRALP